MKTRVELGVSNGLIKVRQIGQYEWSDVRTDKLSSAQSGQVKPVHEIEEVVIYLRNKVVSHWS